MFNGNLESDAVLEIDLLTSPKVVLPLLRTRFDHQETFSLRNQSNCNLENVVVSVECLPSIIRAKSWNIDRIVAGDDCVIANLETPLDTELLSGLNEAEVGVLRLTVY